MGNLQEKVQGDANDIEFEGSKVALKDGLVGTVEGSKGPWMEDNSDLNPCWPTLLSGMCVFLIYVCIIDFVLFTKDLNATDEAVSSKGYVTFSLTNGPEYHISQVCFIKPLK